MSKLVGASFIAIGTGGIALALLKDTKYDPLVKLGITKPKIPSKIQQDFRCEVLFLKIATNFFATFEIQKQINAITSNEGMQGLKTLSTEEKNRVDELQAQKNKVEKIYSDSLIEYNSTICGQELDAIDCINNGNCSKKIEINCVTLKENIATLTDQYNRYKADPDSNRLSSPARAEMLSSKEQIDNLQELFNKSDCSSKQLVRTEVSYKDVRDCVQKDELIKSLRDDITYRKIKKIKSSTPVSEIFLQKLQDRLLTEEKDFITKGCKGRLESDKLKSNAITITDLASQQEKNVLNKNFTEQYVYIGVGALVLLTGFYIVLKK